jgi:hypothetical protein
VLLARAAALSRHGSVLQDRALPGLVIGLQLASDTVWPLVKSTQLMVPVAVPPPQKAEQGPCTKMKLYWKVTLIQAVARVESCPGGLPQPLAKYEETFVAAPLQSPLAKVVQVMFKPVTLT